jgi:Xaa-Pro aminopeptidase
MRSREAGPSTVVDARELIHEMRVVKDADEIALIRRATEISGRGHVLAMKAAAPGRYEFEVQQALDGYCFSNGARRMAYPSIAASGPNSVFLHWERNDRQMEDGDVVLNDSGAEYGYYATDITRTYPVAGRFTAEQRAIYDVVLAAQKAAMAQIRPGALFDRVGAAAARVQTEGLVKLGLLSGNVEKLLRESGHRVLTKHGVSHWVGLDVHDAGRYTAGAASRPLEPGMVFTVEPGIYVGADSGADRRWWNIGIRIEDVVLVTRDGYECLSCSVPREIVEVEEMVRSGRKMEDVERKTTSQPLP